MKAKQFKTCKICKEQFRPRTTLDKYCSLKCKPKEEFKKKKPIRKVAAKRSKELTDYSKLRKAYLITNPNCEMCHIEATEIHHKAGRENIRLNEIKNFMAICRECHSWVHDNAGEARKLGYLI